MKKVRMRVYVDVGSHNKPFVFMMGTVADRYPELMHVFHKKVTPDLKPAILEYNVKEKR